MRILIIGAGAVGGYFGARLAAAGRDVTFLVRPHRAEQLRRTGLDLTSDQGDLHIEPNLILASDLHAGDQPFDLILLSTKAYSLTQALADFTPAVGPDTAILPLVNGMKHLDLLDATFGPARVLGGATRINADLDPEGRVLQDGPLHDIIFGERDKSLTPRIQRIDATLRDCGFPTTLSPDVLAAMWMKWVLLSSLAGCTCLLRGTIGEIASTPGGADISAAIVAESAAIAAANGYPQSPDFLSAHTARLADPHSTQSASMYRDLLKGAPVESDHILGDLLARGRAHSVDAPLLGAAFVQLSIYSASRPAA
jgi:2-dehydropantoate 2-reductase